MRVWRLSVAYIGPKKRTERPIGRLKLAQRYSPRHTWLEHHFQGQKAKGQLAGGGAYCGGLPHSLFLRWIQTKSRLPAWNRLNHNWMQRLASSNPVRLDLFTVRKCPNVTCLSSCSEIARNRVPQLVSGNRESSVRARVIYSQSMEDCRWCTIDESKIAKVSPFVKVLSVAGAFLLSAFNSAHISCFAAVVAWRLWRVKLAIHTRIEVRVGLAVRSQRYFIYNIRLGDSVFVVTGW